MKKKYLSLGFAIFLPTTISLAQDLDEPILFDESTLLVENSSRKTSKLNQYITGEFGTIVTTNGGIERESSLLNIGVDIPWRTGKVYLAYGGITYKASIDQVLQDPEKTAVIVPLERKLEASGTDNELREAAIELKLGQSITLAAGRIRNPWGVFEILSPIFMTLPTRDNFTSLIPNKIDLNEAQEQVSLSLFPTSRMEIQLIKFFNIRNNKSLEENFRSSLILYYTDGNTEVSERKLNYRRDIGTDEQQAIRLLFYPNWGKIGFTRFQGKNSFTPLVRGKVAAVTYQSDNLILNTYENEQDTYLFYPDTEMVGIEMEVPISRRWVWQFEQSQSKTLAGLGFTDNFILTPKDHGDFTATSQEEFFNAIGVGPKPAIRESLLQGTSLYQAKITLSSLGLLYAGKKWKSTFTILELKVAPEGEQAKRIKQAYEELQAQAEITSTKLEAYPIFASQQSRGDKNQHHYGYAVGVVGVGIGIGGVYSYNFTENLLTGIAIGYSDISSNFGQKGLDYRVKNEGSPTMQIHLGWRF